MTDEDVQPFAFWGHINATFSWCCKRATILLSR
jgi:hypothetical protein